MAEVEEAAEGRSVDPVPAETVPVERVKRMPQQLSATVVTLLVRADVEALVVSDCASGMPVCLHPVKDRAWAREVVDPLKEQVRVFAPVVGAAKV